MNPYRELFQAMNEEGYSIDWYVSSIFSVWYRSIMPNREYLLWCKKTTPAERLDWLAAVRELVVSSKQNPQSTFGETAFAKKGLSA